MRKLPAEALIVVAAALSMLRCSSGDTGPVAGGGSDTEVCGVVLYATGEPAPGVRVTLAPYDGDPVESATQWPTDTTDSSGAYAIRGIERGCYNLEAMTQDGNASALQCGLCVQDSTTRIWRSDTLRPLGLVQIPMPPRCSAVRAYVFARGTSLWAPVLSDDGGTMVRLAVHAGVLPPLMYACAGETPVEIAHHIQVAPREIAVISPAATWLYSARVEIRTGDVGMPVGGTVTDFPLLVRLRAPDFDFSQCRPDGADIRFSRRQHYLAYEIEQWDPGAGEAAVWVRVDTIHSSNDSQFITMHWGHPEVSSWECSERVFSRARGYASVWHLNDLQVLADASSRGRRGTNAGAQKRQGIVGGAAALDGAGAVFLPTTIWEGVSQHVSIGVWLYGVPELQPSDGYVFLGKNSANQRVVAAMVPWSDGAIHWQAGRSHSLDTLMRYADSAQQYEGQWNYWVFTKDASSGVMRIYYNGALWYEQTGRYGTVDGITVFALGDCVANGHHYGGAIDEFRISSVVWDEAVVKLNYETQRPDQTVVRVVR